MKSDIFQATAVTYILNNIHVMISTFFVVVFYYLGFTVLSRIFHLYRAVR